MLRLTPVAVAVALWSMITVDPDIPVMYDISCIPAPTILIPSSIPVMLDILDTTLLLIVVSPVGVIIRSFQVGAYVFMKYPYAEGQSAAPSLSENFQ